MQYNEFEAISSEKIREVLQGGDFETVAELEDALIEIRNVQQEAEHVRALKKRRTAHYDSEIKKMEERETILREAVERFMQNANKKSLKYPGVGSFSRRSVKGKWNIENEDALIAHCEKLGIGSDAYEQVYKINKSKINKILDELNENNNLPEGISKEDDRESLTVTIEKDAESPQAEQVVAPKEKTQASQREEYDGIEI